MRKKLFLFLLVFALITSAVPAFANDPTDAEIIPDILLVRPLGVAAVVLGSAIFVLALPAALVSRSVGKTAERLVLDPVEFTFVRPLGNFDYKLGTWTQPQGETE